MFSRACRVQLYAVQAYLLASPPSEWIESCCCEMADKTFEVMVPLPSQCGGAARIGTQMEAFHTLFGQAFNSCVSFKQNIELYLIMCTLAPSSERKLHEKIGLARLV